jgi:hypothetical protein
VLLAIAFTTALAQVAPVAYISNTFDNTVSMIGTASHTVVTRCR